MKQAKNSYKPKEGYTQIRNDVLDNLARVNLKKRDYYRFIMVLIRESFGKKNMPGRNGKYIPWEPKAFVAYGIRANKLSTLKAELLSMRVIRTFYKTQIGFNWHFDQWKVEWYLPPVGKPTPTGVKDTTPTGVEDYPQQGKELPPPGKEISSKAVTGTDLQTLKKEKKKERVIPVINKNFDIFWSKWKTIEGLTANKKKRHPALEQYTLLVNLKGITPQQILDALEQDMKGDFVKTRESAMQQGKEPGTYLQGAVSWLESMLERSTGDSPQGQYVGRIGSKKYTQEDVDHLDKKFEILVRFREEERELTQEEHRAYGSAKTAFYHNHGYLQMKEAQLLRRTTNEQTE
jgi:hypothetical protein